MAGRDAYNQEMNDRRNGWTSAFNHHAQQTLQREKHDIFNNSHTELNIGAFTSPRKDPDLPAGYDWGRQKRLYAPPNLLRPTLLTPHKPSLDHKFGYVFCHRALYDRARDIVDNSKAAIENGVENGYYLHELDSFIYDRLEETIVAHEKGAWRVTPEDIKWKNRSVFEVLKTFLVTRRVNLDTTDFTEAFASTDQTVPDLLSTIWTELLQHSGITLQIDVRDDDFKKVFPYYSYHVAQRSHRREGIGFELFRSIMFKGYNHQYESFTQLRKAIETECERVYGRNYFHIEHLPQFPPLLMVITPEALLELFKREYPASRVEPFDLRCQPSYQNVRAMVWRQISSFVDIGDSHYHFMLEVCHSGLGLGYDVDNDQAWNPLTGKRIKSQKVHFDARLDRALIDVCLELKSIHKGLRFASCTRLPDVILPTGNYTANYLTSRLSPWKSEEEGIASRLMALHGGLYPQSDICIADSAGMEIAARTWIDQHAQLNRADLLRMSRGGYTYQDWLDSSGNAELLNAMDVINGTFMANQASKTVVDAPQDATTAPPVWQGQRVKSLNDWDTISLSIDAWQQVASSLIDDGDYPNRAAEARQSHTSNSAPYYDPRVAITDPSGRLRIFGAGPNDRRRILSVGERHFVFDNVQSAIRASNSLYVYYAIDYGCPSYKAIRRLIAYGADVNALVGVYGTPLALASAKGNATAADFLLRHGAEASIKGPIGYPLQLAAAKGHLDVVRLLLRQTEAASPMYRVALWTACLEGQLAVVQEFMQQHGVLGAALEAACARGHQDIVRYLLMHRANGRTDITSPGLYAACMYGHEGTVRLLLGPKVKCNVNVLGHVKGIESGWSAVAQSTRALGTARRVGGQLRTALAAACAEGHTSIVQLLLHRGAAINFIPRGGASALYWASASGHEPIVRLLLDSGARVDSHRNMKQSALQGARIGGHSNVIQLLLDHGADPTTHAGISSREMIYHRHPPSQGASYRSSYQARMAEEARNLEMPGSHGNYPWSLDQEQPAADRYCGCPLCFLNHWIDSNGERDEDNNDSSDDEDDQRRYNSKERSLDAQHSTQTTALTDGRRSPQPASPPRTNAIELHDLRHPPRNRPEHDYHQNHQISTQYNEREGRGGAESSRGHADQRGQEERQHERDQYDNAPQMTYINQQEINNRSAHRDMPSHQEEAGDRSRARNIAVGAAGGVAIGAVAGGAVSGASGGSDVHVRGDDEGGCCGDDGECCGDGGGCCCCDGSEDGNNPSCTIQ